jgi:hypothetical protein
MASRQQKRGFMHDYGLSVTLCGLFIASWLAQGIFQWLEFVQEEQQHGEVATLGAFIAPFFSATFENWQSEFLQLFTFVILTATLYHKGSHESKDNDEEMDSALVRIEKRLDELGDRVDKALSDEDKKEFKELQEKIDRTRERNKA